MSRFHSLLQLFCTLCALTTYIPAVQAHMEMISPSPWDSPTQADASDRDYDIKSPLQADGSNFPCQGMTKATDLMPTATYSAGQSYNMSITGSANHNGGSCQLSLSYDNGKTFKVIKSMIGGCPVSGTSSYDFEIPLSAPSGTAVFAWTWMNKVGNREFYMDCAVVEIDGNSGGNLCSLPNLYVANIEDINSCATVEGVDPVFPNPGTKVVYGDGMSSSSKASTSSGQCELPDDSCSSSGSSSFSNSTSESSASTDSLTATPISTPTRSAIRKAGNNNGMAMAEAAMTVSSAVAQSAAVTSSPVYTVITSVGPSGMIFAETVAVSVRSDGQPVANTIAPAGTAVSVRSDGQPVANTINQAATTGAPAPASSTCSSSTTTVVVTAPAPAATCSAPVVNCNCGAGGGTCTPINACTTSCVGGTVRSTLVTSIMRAPSSTPAAATTPAATGTATSDSSPPYATGDVSAYDPCNPGSFLCQSSTVFYTCDQQNGGWEWEEPRTVADGMMCLPFASPDSSGSGTYRDDRYVRSRPNGDCDSDGAIQCENGGQSFWKCDQGGWIDMGSVAEGTTCRDGEIVAS